MALYPNRSGGGAYCCSRRRANIDAKDFGLPRFPSETNCTLTISGREMEVLQAGAEYAVSTHGHVDGPELRKQLQAIMKDEVTTPI